MGSLLGLRVAIEAVDLVLPRHYGMGEVHRLLGLESSFLIGGPERVDPEAGAEHERKGEHADQDADPPVKLPREHGRERLPNTEPSAATA